MKVFPREEFSRRFGVDKTRELDKKITTPMQEWFVNDVVYIRLDKPYRLLANGIAARLFF